MRDPGWYSVETGPEIRPKEKQGFTCFHCQTVVEVKPFCDPADAGGLCYVCNRHICPKCVGKECVPFMKKIEREEAKAAAIRSYGV